MSLKEHSQLLDLVIDRAPRLRSAGVVSLEIEGLKISLAAHETEPAALVPAEEQEDVDVLNDPATYGRTKGVPGRKRDDR